MSSCILYRLMTYARSQNDFVNDLTRVKKIELEYARILYVEPTKGYITKHFNLILLHQDLKSAPLGRVRKNQIRHP